MGLGGEDYLAGAVFGRGAGGVCFRGQAEREVGWRSAELRAEGALSAAIMTGRESFLEKWRLEGPAPTTTAKERQRPRHFSGTRERDSRGGSGRRVPVGVRLCLVGCGGLEGWSRSWRRFGRGRRRGWVGFGGGCRLFSGGGSASLMKRSRVSVGARGESSGRA